MEYAITIAISVTSAMLVFILQSVLKENNRLKEEREVEKKNKETALETGVRQLLSVRLEEMYEKYSECENITTRVHDRWRKLHSAYKGLHGNGTFDLMDKEMNDKHIVSK